MKKITVLLILLLAGPAFATKSNLLSAYSKTTTAAEFLTELDTTIVVASTASSWFALVQLTANNTTPYNATVQILLRESLVVVPDNTVTVTLQPGTGTYQLPVQFQGTDLGLGSHTFRVRVNQSTNSPIIYQTSSFLELSNNTGSGGVVSGGGDVVGPGASIDNRVVIFDGTDGALIADNGFWTIDPATGIFASVSGTRIGINDTTPDAQFESVATVAGLGAGLFTCATASPGSLTCAQIDNTATGGAGDIKMGLQVTSSGTYDSDVYGIRASATGGTNTNTAIEAAAGNLVVTSGRIGVRDFTPDALIDVEADASILVAAIDQTCSGARTAGHSCQILTDSSTSSTNSIYKNALIISSAGTWNGSGSRNHAMFVSASGGTENYALWANNGSVVVADGTLGVGAIASLGRIDSRTTDTSAALNTTCTGTAAGPSATCNLMTNSIASTVPGVSNYGLFLTNDAVQAGAGSSNTVANLVVSGASPTNRAMVADASGGTVNQALFASNGDIVVGSGKIANASDSTPDAYLDILTTDADEGILATATGSGNALSVAATGSQTDPHIAMIVSNSKTGGSGGNFKSGIQVVSGGAWTGVNAAIVSSASGGSLANVAFGALAGDILVAAGNVQLDGGEVTATQPSTLASAFDGTCSSGSATQGCLKVTSNGAGPVMNLTASAPNVGIDGLKAQLTGQDINGFVFNIDSESDGIAKGIVLDVDGNGNGNSFGLEINVYDTLDGEAIRVLGGNVDFGTGLNEGFAYTFATKQTALNNGPNSSTSAIFESHSTGVAAISAFAAGTDGVGITSDLTGAVTTASIGNAFANGQTSSTASINKMGLSVSSTGTWNGASAINAGVLGVASGGTRNFAFWAQQGGVLSDSVTLNPISSAPLTCNATNEGSIAYDSDINTVCVCSDSDAGTFEWEGIGLPLIDCFT